MHIGKFYHISCNAVLCESIVFVCMYIHDYYYYYYNICRRILSEVNLKGGWVRAGRRGGSLDLDR